MLRKTTYALLTLLASIAYAAQSPTPPTPAEGPVVMLGAVDMREAAIWIQTRAPEKTTLEIREKGAAQPLYRIPVETLAENACATTVHVGPLKPGTDYQYVLGAGTPSDFHTPANYRDRTPPPDFKVAFGGGHHDNDKDFDPPFKTPGGAYYIYSTILAQKPEVMIWTGDNTVLREGDWGSRWGILDRYRKSRATPELQPLLRSIPNIALWGAGETADGDRFLWNIDTLKDAFRLYWANPSFGVPGSDSNATQLRYNDVEFFLLDDRTFRDMSDPNQKRNRLFGKEQLDWLLEALTRSNATFKVIVTNQSLLCPIDLKNKPLTTAAERDAFLEAAKARGIEGLLFISGGKPFGETTKFVRANGYDLHDFCVGPLTGRPDMAPNTVNYLKVPGSTTRGRQFGILSFSGPEEDRAVDVTIYDAEGKTLYTQKILRSQLR